jgi:hypothetical protein
MRHRFWHHAAQDLGVPLAPFFISEFYPSVHRPLNDLPIEDVVARYAAYDAQLAEDPLCLGVTPFTLGGGGGWAHEDHNRFYPGLLDYAVSVKNRDNVTSTPPPPPSDGATHVVAATWLNTRLWPWGGQIEPPKVRLLALGTRVRVDGLWRNSTMGFDWGCISPDGNEWVNTAYLKAL